MSWGNKKGLEFPGQLFNSFNISVYLGIDSIQKEMSEISKNINNGEINAGGAVIIGDNNEVKILHILGNLQDYQNLEQEIAEAREIFNAISLDKQEIRLKFSGTLEAKKEKLENIKKAIEQAFEYISKLTISTDRLDQAKALFLEGDIPGALEILKDEAIQADYIALQTAKQSEEDRHSHRMEEIAEKTKGIAEEWKMKAVLMATQYEDGDWFEKTKGYYEKALEVERSAENLFEYALFLHDHNQYNEALIFYVEALKIFRLLAAQNPQVFEPGLARTLNNLALLHRAKNELEKAEEGYIEALKIRRSLAEQNLQAFEPYVAQTLNNLALLHRAQNELGKAEEEYSEALKIRRSLAAQNPKAFMPDLARTLNNLAILYSDKKELEKAEEGYIEALKIRRSLAAQNPKAYMPDVATTLNSLANLHCAKNELEKAEEEYIEALKIRRSLAAQNPKAFEPYVAQTLNNLGILHNDKNELEKAEEEYVEALKIRRSLAAQNPKTYEPYLAITLNSLALLHHAKNELEKATGEYIEALKIRRSLAAQNPKAYEPYLARTLNNLALLHCAKNELEKAEEEYREALQIRRSLAQRNSQAFLPDLANTASNMALFYQNYIPDREKSLELVKEALRAATPFQGYLKNAQDSIRRAMNIIRKWGLDVEEFLKGKEVQ